MIDQLRSELLKLRSTPTLAVLLLAAVGLSVLGACLEGLSPTPTELAAADTQRLSLGAGSSGTALLATFAGLIAVTSEFRYGTIRPTLLVQPRRGVVLAAKLGAAALAGTLFALTCEAASSVTGLTILAVRGADVALTTGDVLALVLGTLIRNQTGAIVAVAAYALLIDAALFAAVPSIGRFLPGKAGDALAVRPVEHLLSQGSGAAVLAAWALALVTAAAVRSRRSDV